MTNPNTLHKGTTNNVIATSLELCYYKKNCQHSCNAIKDTSQRRSKRKRNYNVDSMRNASALKNELQRHQS